MVAKEELYLRPVEIEIFERTVDNSVIAFAGLLQPDITSILRKVRKAIIIYIDNQDELWVNVGNGYEKINSQQLLAIMEKYDIEWRNKEDNLLAAQEKIDRALSIYLGKPDGLVIKEKYRSENICHYSIELYHENERRINRGNSK